MRPRTPLLSFLLLLIAAPAAEAQTIADDEGPAERQTPVPGLTGAPPPPSANPTGGLADLFAPSRSNMLGGMFGLRDLLGQYGISFGLQETSEVFGNVTGGIRQGAAYDGLTQMSVGLDTEKAFGWQGGVFNISALQIHGQDLTAQNLAALQPVSGIEAERSTRLWEMWLQQSVLNGAADIKIGQQSVDQEFMVSQYSGLFLNSVMGWPVVPTVDLYAGGPSYPLSSLGVRLRAQPAPNVTVLAGVFNDNPPGGPFENDSQLRGAEAAGAAFNLNTGALWMGEVQYALNPPAADGRPQGLPGTYKFGAYYDSGAFPAQRMVLPGGGGAAEEAVPARIYQGNFSFYALADQMVWRPEADGPQSLGVFARVQWAPPDRNLISLGADAGADLKAPLPGRDDDTFGVGFGIARISSDLNQAPRRGAETFIEITYQVQVAPWWTVQPDAQYILRPGGGLPDPQAPYKLIGNELVFGLRTNVVF